MIARKNHQYSARGARPLKSAYFSIGRLAQSTGDMLFIDSPLVEGADASVVECGGQTLVPRRLPAVAECLCDMDPADLVGAGEVGDRPRDPDHAVEAACAQPHRGSRIGKQPPARL